MNAALTALGLLILILDGRGCIAAAREGVSLCLSSVIPALLPFVFLSQLLISGLLGRSGRVFSVPERILSLPGGAGCLYLAGLLGGYPTGAQLVAQVHRDQLIHDRQLFRLSVLCANPGPAFLFGVLANAFSHRLTLWLLWVGQILSTVAVSTLLYAESGAFALPPAKPLPPSAALRRTATAMAQICGWVILFRVVSDFVSRWFLFAAEDGVRVLFAGILELTAGCLLLTGIESEALRILLCAGFLSFGGLCVVMQTASVSPRLPLGRYLRWKFLQSGLSVLFALPALLTLPHIAENRPESLLFCLILPAVTLLILLLFRQKQKSSSILRRNGVELNIRSPGGRRHVLQKKDAKSLRLLRFCHKAG